MVFKLIFNALGLFGFLCLVRYVVVWLYGIYPIPIFRHLAVLRGLIWPVCIFLGWVLLLGGMSISLDYLASDIPFSMFIDTRFPDVPMPADLATSRYSIQNLFNLALAILFATAIFSLALPGLMDSEKDEAHSVVLDDSSSMVKWFLDLIGGKHSIFKNSYRGWHQLQALFLTSIVILIIMTLGLATLCMANKFAGTSFSVTTVGASNIRLDVLLYLPIGFISLWYVAYQRIVADHTSKWAYCADLYNKMIEEGSSCEISAIRAALALDLLATDLWAKRSFAREFKTVLNNAISASTKA